MIQFLFGLISFGVLFAFFYFVCKFLRKYEKKGFVVEILVSVVIVQIFKWSFIDITRVPSSSMEKTLIPGDFVLVSKLHYGPRTPSTLLQIPLTHQTTKFFEFKSYLDWLQIPCFRFPGFTTIKTNDVVVFNTPSENDIPMDVRRFFVKRAIGLPGQRVRMVNGRYYVNNKKSQDPPLKIYEFVLKTSDKLHKNWFKKYNITEYEYFYKNSAGMHMYILKILAKYDIDKTVEDIKNDPYTQSIMLKKQPDQGTFVAKFDGYIDIVNWGGTDGILVPKKGLKIELNKSNIDMYWHYMKSEMNKSIERKNGYEIYLNGKVITDYTFLHDYYFMIGDNIYDSCDSRYWGFVRDDEIYAKPLFTILSKSQDSLLGGLKFRFLKGMWD